MELPIWRANNSGGIYKLTTAESITDLHDFNEPPMPPVWTMPAGRRESAASNRRKLLRGEWFLWAYGEGSIYKLTPANVFTAFLFPNPPVDGAAPLSTMIQPYERAGVWNQPRWAAQLLLGMAKARSSA